MRSLLLTIIACSCILTAVAQKPEIIYSFARERKPIPWYKEQQIAWKNELDHNPKNAAAWFYYYKVSRNLMNVDTTDKRPRKEKAEEIGKIVVEMEKNVPESYEYNLCKFSHEGNNFSYVAYLKKADELGQDRWEHLDFMINWGEIDRDREKLDTYAGKWFGSGEVSSGLLFYNHNVIMGTKQNAIIFTAGDNDTYPIWILQSQGIRRDITILNFYLLHIDDYRNKIFKELGVEKWNMQHDNAGKDSGTWDEKLFKEEIIKHVAANKKNYPVYLALTTASCEDYVSKIADNLYLTGLVYQYSSSTIDNMAILKRNFEQLFALDYIDKPFFNDISSAMVKQANGNYIVPMLKLYDHYEAAGDVQRRAWIRGKLLSIAKGTEEEQEVKKHVVEN